MKEIASQGTEEITYQIPAFDDLTAKTVLLVDIIIGASSKRLCLRVQESWLN